MPSAGALRAGRAVIEASLSTKLFKGQFKALERQTSKLARNFGRLTGGALFGGGGFTSGFLGLRNLFVGSAAAAALAWPVKMAANIELSAAQMSVFTGSTEEAEEKILQLLQFSAVAFQDVETLVTQMRLLMTRGIDADTAFDDIRALAVLAAGSTEEFQELTKAFADVKNATRLTGEEMRQFKNTAFNPLVEIAKRTGESVDTLQKRLDANGISFEEVRAALRASVNEGGRFHGILEAISQTLIGQMRQAWAQLKVIIKPLGDELAKPVKSLLEAINGALPAMGQLINKHKEWLKVALQIALGVAGLAVAFITFGLSIQILAIALSGVASVFGIVFALIGVALNPITLLTAGVVYFASVFVEMGKHVGEVVGTVVNYFRQLGRNFGAVLSSMGDALMGGDVKAAADVLFAGLRLAFQEGTDDLENIWLEFKFGLADIMLDFWADMRKGWEDFTTALGLDWKLFVNNLKAGPGFLLTDVEKANLALRNLKTVQDSLNKSVEKQKEIERDREQAKEALRDEQGKAIQAAKDELEVARNNLSIAQERAKSARDRAQLGTIEIPGFDPGSGAAAASKALSSQAIQDPRFLQQVVGGNPEQREQTQLLFKIEKNTRKFRIEGDPTGKAITVS